MTKKFSNLRLTEAIPAVPTRWQTNQRKLDDDQVRDLRRRYAAGGVSQRQLAKELGISKNAVQKALSRRSYKHVD